MNNRIFIIFMAALTSGTLSSIQLSIFLNHENLPAPVAWKLLNVRINDGKIIDIKKPQIFGIDISKDMPYLLNVQTPLTNITLTDQIHETTYQETGQRLVTQTEFENTRQWLITIPSQFSGNDLGIVFSSNGSYKFNKRPGRYDYKERRGSSSGQAQLLKEDKKILRQITVPN